MVLCFFVECAHICSDFILIFRSTCFQIYVVGVRMLKPVHFCWFHLMLWKVRPAINPRSGKELAMTKMHASSPNAVNVFG